MNGLEPYTPSPECPWDRAAAAHLLRRAGFAPSDDELQAALRDGPNATVARLVDSPEESARHLELDVLGDRLSRRDDIDGLRAWWLLRMCRTARPLHARVAAFWHNHFATSNAKVRSPARMLAQLRAIEKHALGRFEDLLLAMARDPAMIVWLDGGLNSKGRPNENFARELFELFSLGVGHYSERDIKEAARAFTGWHQRDSGRGLGGGEFHFTKGEHDNGEKTVLGATGDLDGTDVVRIAASQPACARFLAAKLLREFLCPQPLDDLVAALSERLSSTGLDVGDAVRVLLASRAMFDRQWRSTRIKSPVELAVGIVRSLEMQVPGPALADAVSQMGQRLFEPPSVKGWDGHRVWLNTATMLVRLNAATAATGGGERGFDAAAMCARHGLADRDEAVRFAQELTCGGEATEPVRTQLAAIARSAPESLRGAVRLILTSPEYQMC